MTWFAVSVLLAERKRPGADDDGDTPFHAWETVLLIHGADPDDAVRQAKVYGERATAAQSEDADDEPPAMEFMGVRYIRELAQSPEETPDEPLEVTYTEVEVASRGDLLKLASNYPVLVRYVG